MIVPGNILREGNKGSYDLIGNVVTNYNDIVTIDKSFTIAFFFKILAVDNSGNVAPVLSSRDDGTLRGYGLELVYSTLVQFRFIIRTTNYIRQLLFDTSLDDFLGSWHFAALIFDRGTMSAFFDNEYKTTTQIPEITTNTRLITPGRGIAGTPRRPTIYASTLLQYMRVIGLNELKLLSKGIPISNAGLVGKWKLNETDSIPFDSSGKNNHATNLGAIFTIDKPF